MTSIAGSTLLAFLLLGYHPFAEDGGIYAAAIAARLDPSLFPKEHIWVEGHTRLTLFVPAIAGLFVKLHLPLDEGLLLLQLAGLFAALAAAWLLAKHCFGEERSAHAACLLFATCAGLPIAGTSLYLIDPYVTARTLSTPLLLFAVLFVLQERWVLCGTALACAALVHPLMTLWGSLLLVFLVLARSDSRRVRAVCLSGLLLFGAGVLFWRHADDSALLHTLALGRAYWFLSRWRWYEVFGAFAPCILLQAFLKDTSLRQASCLRRIAESSWWITGTVLAVALCFARIDAHTSVIAKCQPLRALHLVFALFLILSSGALASILPTRARKPALLAIYCLLGLGAGSMQWMLYPASPHLELPGTPAQGGWMQTFAWIRHNTSKGALFALDADYNSMQGEDAQGFRAATLRSVLPDRSKDGGVASVVPSLAEDWLRGVQAQEGLNKHLDAGRQQRLRQMGVSWVVLTGTMATGLPCPYRNNGIQVCRLGAE